MAEGAHDPRGVWSMYAKIHHILGGGPYDM